jgi:hypothetical protein
MPAARSASSDSEDGRDSRAGAFASSRPVRVRLNTSPAATAAMAISPTPNVRIGTSFKCFEMFRLTGGRDTVSATGVPIAPLYPEITASALQVP